MTQIIGFVCPTYQAGSLHRYTERSLQSFFETTPGGVAIVVDDASSDWTDNYVRKLQAIPRSNSQQLLCHHFQHWGGLTRSWNEGLQLAADCPCDYAIAGNNDVVFTPGWFEPFLTKEASQYAMLGPLSNAPGVTAKGKQDISQYVPDYKLTDSAEDLAVLASRLRQQQAGRLRASLVNGFFQFASVPNWLKGRFDASHFYRPINPRGSRGQINHTPLMTLNEDELQARWQRKKMLSAVVCDSFIFHYRAVSRGEKYKKGRWYRQK